MNILLQLQNSKTVIQAKDAVIQELKEKVAYLEAEVRPSRVVLGSALGLAHCWVQRALGRAAEAQPSPGGATWWCHLGVTKCCGVAAPSEARDAVSSGGI